MPKRYSRQFRKMVAELICVQTEGTIKTAEEFGVPGQELKRPTQCCVGRDRPNKMLRGRFPSGMVQDCSLLRNMGHRRLFPDSAEDR